MLNREKSAELTKEFNKYYPGGHSEIKIPMFITDHRLFVNKSKGSHIWDVDGNEYIEFHGSMGPNVLGHANPEYVERIHEYMVDNGTAVGSNILFSPMDVENAQTISKLVPCVEEVKFTTSGTEAVQMAFRVMRAYTGKPVIIRFYHQYAGWLDDVLGGGMAAPGEKPNAQFGGEDDLFPTQGRSPWAGNGIFFSKWNDMKMLEDIVEKYHDEIAGIHFEGIVWNHDGLYPRPEFIKKIRELCDKYNMVMSVDEVITGFRVDIGGAQKVVEANCDICTMGKAIGNGIPIACLGGKKEVMDVIRGRNVLAPGTYSGYGLGMKAIQVTLDMLQRNNCEYYPKVYAKQEVLMDGLVKAAEKNGIEFAITESNGVFNTLFDIPGGRIKAYDPEEVDCKNYDKQVVFQQYMQDNGIIIMFGGRWYMTSAHTDEDVAKTIDAAEKSMKAMVENNFEYVAK